MKRCNVCGERKPLDDFYRSAGMADGYRNDCKVCNLTAKAVRTAKNPQAARDRTKKWQTANPERVKTYRKQYRARPDRKLADRDAHLRRKFGIGIDDYECMLDEQGGGCWICGAPPPKNGSLHVDHDHETGEVRGLLCISCNNSLGGLKESVDILERAIEYVDRDPELDALVKERVNALRR